MNPEVNVTFRGLPTSMFNVFRILYRASCLVVVPVHGRASIWTILSGVGKLSGNQHPKLCVLAAAAPLPALTGRPLVVGVTAAHGGCALSTGARHCKRNAC